MPNSKLSKKLLLLENASLKFNVCGSKKSCAVHEFNMKRVQHGEFNNLYRQARFYDDKFFEYLRMNKETFDFLLGKVRERLSKTTTNFKEPISAEERLVITLR